MQSLVRFTGILITATIFLTGCANFGKPTGVAAEIAQTPITENPSGNTYPGKFIWHDLITPDPQLAGKFYEQLFGWQIDYQGQYAVVRNDGKLIAGIVKVEPSEGRDRPIRPQRPVTLPATGRPSRLQMTRPARMPRGGGGRRR